jgi:hypothetical protein
VAVHSSLKAIAENGDDVCAERIPRNLVRMAQHLVHHGELEVIPELRRYSTRFVSHP